MITLSGLQHVAACPGSVSIPRIQRAGGSASALGSAIHELIETTIAPVADAPPEVNAEIIALARGLATDDAGRLAFLASNLRLPIPAGALAEVPLGYWSDGTVRRVTGGAGSYEDEGQILSGTIDAMWAEPEPLTPGYSRYRATDPWDPMCPPGSTLWITDWKGGDDEHVTPIDRNWQLRGAAVLAARWTGARRVIPALCFVNAAECAVAVREGRVYEGRWEVGAPLDAAALVAIEADMRAVLARARGAGGHGEDGLRMLRVPVHDVASVQDREQAAGSVRVPQAPIAPLVLGPHCEHCPARGACPALAAEAMTLARGDGLYLPPGGALTRDAASRLAALLAPARRFLDAVEVAVRAHAEAHGPIPLADGREYGPATEEATTYKTAPTFEALAAVVGDEAANEAFETSTAALKRAVDGKGRGAWKALRADIEARGGVVPSARVVWRKRWPAVPVEVSDARANGVEGEPGRSVRDSRDGHVGNAGLHDVAQGDPGEGREGAGDAQGERVARAPCAVCGRLYTLARGVVRRHSQPGGGLRCEGGSKAPKGAEGGA